MARPISTSEVTTKLQCELNGSWKSGFKRGCYNLQMRMAAARLGGNGLVGLRPGKVTANVPLWHPMPARPIASASARRYRNIVGQAVA
jgi:hypothetical protein